MLTHELSRNDKGKRVALPGNIEYPKDSSDWAGVKTMAPEGAILSFAFASLARPDGFLGGARSPAEDLCDRVFFRLVAEFTRMGGLGRDVGVFGVSVFFRKPPAILPST